MREVLITFISLIILLVLSTLAYLAWTINKGEFSSQYLEKFINDKFKTENFYTSIKEPIIKFDKKEKRIIVDGKNFKIFSIDNKKLSEFENLKIHINFMPLITKRKLETNKIEFLNGQIDMPDVFKNPLKISLIELKGDLNPNQKEIIIDNFKTIINEDFYEGSAKLDLSQSQAEGVLNKLYRNKIFYNLDLSAKNMKFIVNKNNFNVTGDATLGGVDVYLEGQKNYKDKSVFVSKYNLSGKIDEKDIYKAFNIKPEPYFSGIIDLDATYLILDNNTQTISTSNNFKNAELNIPALSLIKDKDIDATADIDFNFLSGRLNEIKIINYKEGKNEMDGLIKFSKEFKPYKSLKLNLKNDDKKISLNIVKNKDVNILDINGDYFDFSKTLNETINKKNDDKGFLMSLQPLKGTIKAKEIFISDDRNIYDVLAKFDYKKNKFNNVDLKAKFKNEKKFSFKLSKNKDVNILDINGDYFDFSKTLKETFVEDKKEDSFLNKLQPININLKAKEIMVAEEKSIFKTNAILKYENKVFKEVNLNSELSNNKKFNIMIKPKKSERELSVKSDDAGLFLKTFNINKSGKEGELVLHGIYDDTKDSHPLNSSLTIRDMKLVKAPTLAKILNLASIGIVSALSGEGIVINKLKSEFSLENGVLNLKKYEAYGPDIGFSNQGKIYLKEKEIDLEGAIVPMVTLNKIIGSIPVLGKILTNERKGIWSFVYNITGNLEEPEVKVNPIKTITPGFIQKFFSVFKKEKEEES